MITLLIILIIIGVLAAIVFAIGGALIGGIGVIVTLFSDFIIAGLVIWGIVKLIKHKKK